jgi:uncharacterized protein (TIGR01777 family)
MSARRFSRSADFPVSVATLFAWHERPGAFERLAPPWQRVVVRGRQGGIRDGATVSLTVTANGVPTRWELTHSGYEPNARFVDTLQRGPFAQWVHEHRFEAVSGEHSRLTDTVDYALPFAALSHPLGGRVVHAMLDRVFRYRNALLAHDLQRHAAFAQAPRMRIAVTGATGYIGRALCHFLTTGGHAVLRIGRGPVGAAGVDVVWDPARGLLDSAALEGVDAVIHLAGAPIAVRWTAPHKAAIVSSRVESTALLARTIAAMARPPRVLLSGSAIGIYGAHCGDRTLDETSAPGDDFLARTTAAWEAATAPASEAGIRVVHLRTGLVVGVGGGVLAPQWPLYQLGLAGPIGRGRQYMSPIALNDEVAAIYHCLMRDDVHGPVNLVAPHAVTNAEFTRQVASAIRRPAVFPAPPQAIMALFGREMAEATALASQRVRPTVLERTGFAWGWPTVREMIAFETGRADFRVSV